MYDQCKELLFLLNKLHAKMAESAINLGAHTTFSADRHQTTDMKQDSRTIQNTSEANVMIGSTLFRS